MRQLINGTLFQCHQAWEMLKRKTNPPFLLFFLLSPLPGPPGVASLGVAPGHHASIPSQRSIMVPTKWSKGESDRDTTRHPRHSSPPCLTAMCDPSEVHCQVMPSWTDGPRGQCSIIVKEKWNFFFPRAGFLNLSPSGLWGRIIFGVGDCPACCRVLSRTPDLCSL